MLIKKEPIKKLTTTVRTKFFLKWTSTDAAHKTDANIISVRQSQENVQIGETLDTAHTWGKNRPKQFRSLVTTYNKSKPRTEGTKTTRKKGILYQYKHSAHVDNTNAGNRKTTGTEHRNTEFAK